MIKNSISNFYNLSSKRVSSLRTGNNRTSKILNNVAKPQGEIGHPYPLSFIGDVSNPGLMSPDSEPQGNSYNVNTNCYKNMAPVIFAPKTSSGHTIHKVNTNLNKNSDSGVSVPYIPPATCSPSFGFVDTKGVKS